MLLKPRIVWLIIQRWLVQEAEIAYNHYRSIVAMTSSLEIDLNRLNVLNRHRGSRNIYWQVSRRRPLQLKRNKNWILRQLYVSVSRSSTTSRTKPLCWRRGEGLAFNSAEVQIRAVGRVACSQSLLTLSPLSSLMKKMNNNQLSQKMNQLSIC